MKGGALIVFEGVDGSGKSTQLVLLAEAIRSAGREVVETGEPYDCEPGRKIREMARSARGVAPQQELEWFLEQRRLHVREVVAPALEAGRVVLSDRYFLSTVAYQGARGLDAEMLLAESEAEFPTPDLVLLLEIDPGSGLARVATRGGHQEPAFEEAAFLERVAVIFRGLDRDYIAHIPADGDIATVHQRVVAEVRSRLQQLFLR
jgi:dTMP kinase